MMEPNACRRSCGSSPSTANIMVTRADLLVRSSHAVKATRAHWAVVQEVQAAMPDASVTLRLHKIGWRPETDAPALILFGVLVTSSVGPFTLRREYMVSEG